MKQENDDNIIENDDVISGSEIETNSKYKLKSFTKILTEMITFFSVRNINIPIVFNELYDFQKAYALLLGVLKKTNYDLYRMNIIISKAIYNWSNIPQLLNLKTMLHIIKIYWQENKQYDKLKKIYNSSYYKYLKYKNKYINIKN
jgi:hypothetical protein